MPTIIWAITQTGDGAFTVPPHVISLEAYAFGGGGGANVWASPISPKSGGAGAFAQTNAFTVTPGQVLSYHVGAGGVGGSYVYHYPGEQTWLGSSNIFSPSCVILADAAGVGVPGSQNGGNAGASKGDITVTAGSGAVNTLDQGPDQFGGGAAGGGAAGPNGGGANGHSGGSGVPPGGNGGQGDNGTGGLGGVYANLAPGSPGTKAASGANGAEIVLTGDLVYINGVPQTGKSFTFGAGGGGASAIPPGLGGTPCVANGGDGGLYGGGGGTGAGADEGGASINFGGSGAQGILVIVYTPVPQPRSQVHIYG